MPVNIKKPDGSVVQPPAPPPDPIPAELLDEQQKPPPTKGKGKKAPAAADGKGPPPAAVMSLAQLKAAVLKAKPKSILKGSEVPDVQRIPTGIFELDLAIGGGFPRGRVSIVFGVESSGKTNACLKAISYVQHHFPESCNKCVYVDLENRFDAKWAAKMGVDTDALEIVKPAYGEEAVDIVDALLRASDLGLMVVDSIAVMIASAEIAKSTEVADVSTSAILIKRMTNKAVIALAQQAREGKYPGFILINQRRFKSGRVMGDPETMPGGETPKFLSSLTLRMYGRNVVDKAMHPTMPAWKETDVIVKKASVPITASNVTYKMAMVPAEGLDIGDTNSWNTVKNHLASQGKLIKDPNGWRIFGELFKVQSAIEERYLCELGFRVKCQQAVIEALSDQKFIIPEHQESAPEDVPEDIPEGGDPLDNQLVQSFAQAVEKND